MNKEDEEERVKELGEELKTYGYGIERLQRRGKKKKVWQVAEGEAQSWVTSQIVLKCPHCMKQTRVKVALEI